MTVAERQARLIEDLGFIEDRQERLAAAVSRARRTPLLAEAERQPVNRVEGCVSQVWLVGAIEGGRLRLRFDADSPMVKGLIGLLVEVYDGAEAADAATVEPVVFEELGFNRDLTPTRRNGLAAVRARIRQLALGAA